MKKYMTLFLLVFLVFEPVQAQSRESFGEEFGIDPDFRIGGLRVNYMQGKDGFVGGAFHFGWHETEYLPFKHVGFAVGSDFRLSKDLLMAPKVTLEYGYYFGVIRAGYLCYTDWNGRTDNRISAEIGFSLLSFVDLTYIHTFGFNHNPFNLGNDYVNLTINVPFIMR
ncbi:hypothetical protein [Fluviicola sp.]|uniref:hypothetical protein n=1 Tax=Fluviicola sp. TaxID=1917219 RepID=UPI0031DF1A3F